MTFQKLKISMENRAAAAASCFELPNLKTSGELDLQGPTFPLLPQDWPREVSLHRPWALSSKAQGETLGAALGSWVMSIRPLLLHLPLLAVCKQLPGHWGFLFRLNWT